MSRVADALKRSRTGRGDEPRSAHDRAAEPIPFFTPAQPAVVVPWKIGVEPHAPAVAAPEPLQPVYRAEPVRSVTSRIESEIALRGRTLSPDYATKLVTSSMLEPVAREQYGKIAAALHEAALERGIKVVMITSASAGEGKTLTASNLALMFSESHQRPVLLIDADLRRPAIHKVFGVSNDSGLSDSLAADGLLPLIQVTPTLSVLTAGACQTDPMKVLTSERMRDLIEEARGKFEWIVLDTAPLGPLPDARFLATMADTVLIVAMAGKTGSDVIQRSVSTLDAKRIFGVVLNRVDRSALSHSSYHYDYYSVGR
jgi:capsular exopolysaccharide synthesis family protein